MRLADLEPQFLAIEDERTSRLLDTLLGANGIMFVCPKCFTEKGQRPGVHSILCWFEGVPLDRSPGPGRWVPAGTNYTDLSFVGPAQASVQLTGGCAAHFCIRNGGIEFC